MKQSDPLQLVEPGSLVRPRPIGRLVRLSLGSACAYAVYQLLIFSSFIINTPVSVIPNLALMSLIALCIVNYVVNIGLGKSWGRWPSIVLLAVLGFAALLAYVLTGTADHPILGIPYWAVLLYFFAHLGLSFLLAALLGTPGCEMRSIPELVGRISGQSVAEHHCPAALITKIDEWEASKSQGKAA